MIPVSVVIVTKNEEKNIREALQSIRDMAEIIIVDAFSSDNTLGISREYTDKIYQAEWQGYAKQKQMAIEHAKGPWVFVLDSDERFTESLRQEISDVVKNNGIYSGFYVPRKNFFLGKWIRHGGWWPDYTLRLFIKDKAFMEDRKVHEKVVVNGKVGHLKNPLEHYTYRNVSDYIKKMDLYSSLSAEELKEKGASPRIIKMVVHPLSTFLKMFFLRRGFMDGVHGLILSILYSCYTFLKYLKLWETSISK
ncbi:MAG: glycosyl transferase [Nitrospirae bacterium RBG_13_39_12]|nr:MAG: glycosyl transferase [Nitrospirae bacterium RBG_13_39_12]